VARLAALVGGGYGRLFIQVDREPGEYCAWSAWMADSVALLWGKGSRVTFTLADGSVVESEACFFTESKLQTKTFDTRRRAVLLDKVNFATTSGGDQVAVMVKFPPGSLRLSDVVGVHVSGVAALRRGGE